MKQCFKIAALILFPLLLKAQENVDSLKKLFVSDDSLSYNIGRFIYSYYEELNRDSALHYADKNLQLARKYNKKLAAAISLDNKGYQLMLMGRYPESLQCLLQAFKIAEDVSNDEEKSWPLFNVVFEGNNRLLALSYTHHMFAILMWQTDNAEQTVWHFMKARNIASSIGHKVRQALADMNLGRSYMNLGKLDSAFLFEKEAESLAFQSGFKKYLGQTYQMMGDILLQKGDKQGAKNFYYQAIQASNAQNNRNSLSANYFTLTNFYLAEKEKDSALKYAIQNLEVIQTLGSVTGRSVNLGTVYENLYLSYKLTNQRDSVFKYQGLTLLTKDSLYKIRIKNLTDFQTVSFAEQQRLQNIEKEKAAYQNKIRTYSLLAGLAVFLLLALILYRNNRQKHQSNKILEKTLDNLKSTQTQLVQSEKMASLGELTAGIAHEIQNPLNFVNNFSEVNKELLIELKEEADKGNVDEVKAIANDVIDNSEKINYHGKRADAIVKGMLQHSRSNSATKEPTDINVLADEYLRLAYHGLRAKEKSFNATLKTDYDRNIGMINIVPQDIGRVILNLITNAFYAVSEKNKKSLNDYQPTVSVSTKNLNAKIEIKVADNGNGIPQNIVDKIFQPFFTTKPTGQGTGLGLSLAYDIVKAHEGELKVETSTKEGTAFIVSLPS